MVSDIIALFIGLFIGSGVTLMYFKKQENKLKTDVDELLELIDKENEVEE